VPEGSNCHTRSSPLPNGLAVDRIEFDFALLFQISPKRHARRDLEVMEEPKFGLIGRGQ
jgi:hypothetical protein